MRCPFCGYADTQVKDSRTSDDGYSIRRRRCCPKCQSRFTTFEHMQMRDLIVVKKNDIRVPFSREKLYKSILLAVSKRDVDGDRIDQIVNGIVRTLESRGEAEIPSSVIISTCFTSEFHAQNNIYSYRNRIILRFLKICFPNVLKKNQSRKLLNFYRKSLEK